MGRSLRSITSGIISSLFLCALPVQAQVTPQQVNAFVEALRLAAPKTGQQHDGLYSDWQVLPGNIPRWSKSCLGRELSPDAFAASPTLARNVVTCVMTDILKEQQRQSGGSEAIAVRRAAAWWMTGDANRFDSGETAKYTQKVLGYYQQQLPAAAATTTTPATVSPSDYDLYMQFGYRAVQRRDYSTALVNFRRALQERPQDRYATQAIQNLESYLQPRSASPKVQSAATTPQTAAKAAATPAVQPTVPPTQPTASPAASQTAVNPSITQDRAVKLINQWLEAKQQIFAPPFDRQPVVSLTTGELYVDLNKANGIIDWLQRHNAYYRFGVQKLESVAKFVAAGNKATMEVNLTEDRTLYRDGKIDPSQTDFQTRRVRFSLQAVNGQWKIADYKTVEGALLERSLPQ